MFWNLDRIIKLKALPLYSSNFLSFEFNFTGMYCYSMIIVVSMSRFKFQEPIA